ncbi:hypothetical protein FQR65_LT16116 [Abscondita terminalis]|nr:hypothetical protein FQR65_LT16116 [Abscondita terminalis]
MNKSQFVLLLHICCVIASNKFQTQSCAMKIMTQIFSTDSTVINFFIEENIISNIYDYPYVVVNASNEIIGVFENYETNFVMQANTILTMKHLLRTLIYDKSRTSENVRMGRFLIITRLKDTRELFWLMWSYRITHVVVIYYDEDEIEDLIIQTANPYWSENKCGSVVNKIQLYTCNTNDVITFPKIIRKYTQCTFLLGWVGDLEVLKSKHRFGSVIQSLVTQIISILHANLSIQAVDKEKHRILGVEYKYYFVTVIFNAQTYYTRTKVYFRDDIIWFGTQAEKSPNTFFIPFNTETWVLIFVVFVVVLIIWWQGLLLQNCNNCKYQIFFQSFSQIASLLFGVSIPIIPKLVCLKILILFYMIYVIHIQTAYTSDMINNLVVPSYEHVINNIYDLANSDLPIFVSVNYTDAMFGADVDNFYLYTKIKKKIISVNRAITFLQEFGFDLKTDEDCNRLQDENLSNDFNIYFTYDLSEYTDWAESLRLKDFLAVLIVYSLGSLTSILIFFIEILIKKWKLKM